MSELFDLTWWLGGFMAQSMVGLNVGRSRIIVIASRIRTVWRDSWTMCRGGFGGQEKLMMASWLPAKEGLSLEVLLFGVRSSWEGALAPMLFLRANDDGDMGLEGRAL